MKVKVAIIFLMATMAFTTAATAQDYKFGYTNVDYILAYMPEAQQVQTELTEYENQLTTQIQTKYQTLQQKLAEYEQQQATMIDAVKADRENEIRQLQQSLQQFQANAENLLQTKQYTLLQPLYNKIQEAIDAVAKENGFTHIFNSSSLLYAPEGEEVSDLIFKKMGITPPATTEGAGTGATLPTDGQ